MGGMGENNLPLCRSAPQRLYKGDHAPTLGSRYRALGSYDVFNLLHLMLLSSRIFDFGRSFLCAIFPVLPSLIIRPLAHRSCLAGCRAGLNTAWDMGCTAGGHQDCVKSATERCDYHCATYRNQFPKPTIFNNCQRSCVDVVDDTCVKAKKIFAAADSLSRSLENEL